TCGLALAEVGAHERCGPAAEQRTAQHVAFLGWHVNEEALSPLCFFHHNRHTVAIENAVRRNRRNGLIRRENAAEVQGIRAPRAGAVGRCSPVASGRAYCSPENPPTNRPPRISPRASSRRKTRRMSRHGASSVSRCTSRRNTTP